ncbi:MAG: glycosyltransferase family 4 protein [Candidatus Woesebacteria bacterium]|nr:MAG: glycosyltransferase family 4 protein [Candidatus Woesebacteria bacterium]
MIKKDKTPVFIISGKSPLSASGGGYSSFAFNLAKIIKKLGHTVYIVALGNETKQTKIDAGKLLLFKATLPLLNVNIYALPGLPIYSIIFARGIQKIADQNGYKKFIVWGIGPWGLAGAFLKIFSKSKVTFYDNYFTTIRHEWWGGVRALRIKDYGLWPKIKYLAIYFTIAQYLALLEKITLKRTDKIITNYSSTEQIINKEFGIDFKKFYRTHSYVQIYKRRVKISNSNDFTKLPAKYLFFFSRQDPRKGVNFLLHAMKILSERDFKIPLIIAGGGDMLKYNMKLATKLKIEKNVKFFGFVNDTEPLMKGCALFAFPSIEEGSSALTIHEAMEMGLPIVTTACDGIVEDIKNGKSGILVPMENPEAMANAIEDIIRNPNLAKKLGRGAKEAYKKTFNSNLVKRELGKLLQKI